MNRAKVQMLGFRVLALECRPNMDHDLNAPDEDYDFRFRRRTPEEIDLRDFMLILGVEVTGSGPGRAYKMIQIDALGRFSIEPDMSDHEIETLGLATCYSLLLGAIRGYVIGVTSAFMYGSVSIPSSPVSDFISSDETHVFIRPENFHIKPPVSRKLSRSTRRSTPESKQEGEPFTGVRKEHSDD